ncbi:MAG: hypothetical protein ACYDEY_04905 [Acidimicrobiales bacterium]
MRNVPLRCWKGSAGGSDERRLRKMCTGSAVTSPVTRRAPFAVEISSSNLFRQVAMRTASTRLRFSRRYTTSKLDGIVPLIKRRKRVSDVTRSVYDQGVSSTEEVEAVTRGPMQFTAEAANPLGEF